MSYTVTFTGGLGAQICSASAYFYLKNEGMNVSADMSYFTLTPKEAKPGNKGELSIWKYQLDNYNIPQSTFNTNSVNYEIISDGVKKIAYAQLGFKNSSICLKFPISSAAYELRDSLFNNEKYVCLHVRRGDYINVASYIVPDEHYLNVLKKSIQDIKNLLVVSDTPISSTLINMLNTLNINIQYIIGRDLHTTHGIMRLSTVLICSNSQFSMTAGFLRDKNYITYIPTDYIGNNNEFDIYIRSLENFKFY